MKPMQFEASGLPARFGQGLVGVVGVLALCLSAACSDRKSPDARPDSPPLQVQGVSSTAPLPMTPVVIEASGIDPAQLVTITYEFADGTRDTEAALRVSADGRQVVAAVPLGMNAESGLPAPAEVRMRLSQGARTSEGVLLKVQDLPAVAAYGVAPGAISRAFLVFRAAQLSEQINVLQSLRIVTHSTIDVESVLGRLIARRDATLLAVAEVDRVVANPDTVVPAGSLPGGEQVVFDRHALEIMDRVLGLYLSQLAIRTDALAQAGLAGSEARPSEFAGQRAARIASVLMHSVASDARAAPNEKTMVELLETFKAAESARQISTGILDAEVSCREGRASVCASDVAGALGAGVSSFGDAQAKAAGTNAAALRSAHLVGAVGAVVSAADATVQAYRGLGRFALAASRRDGAAMDEALRDLNGLDKLQLYSATVGLVLGLPAVAAITFSMPAVGAASALVTLVASVESDYESSVAAEEAQGLRSLAQAASLAARSSATLLEVRGDLVPGERPIPAIGNVAVGGFGGADGSNEMTVDVFAYPGGRFTGYLPLGVAGTDYSRMWFVAKDLVAGVESGSALVDLTGVNEGAPVTIPSIRSNACQMSVSGTIPEFGAEGGSGTLSVSPTAENCAWSAQGSGFVSLPNSRRAGPGGVTFVVNRNSTSAARSATIVVAGKNFVVHQAAPPAAAPACTYVYSEWEACQPDDRQHRSLVSARPEGCQGTPALEQACTFVPPVCKVSTCFNACMEAWLSCDDACPSTPQTGLPCLNRCASAFNACPSNTNTSTCTCY